MKQSISYMKRILSLLAFLLVSLVGMAQAPTNYTNINGRYRWIAGMFDSTFHIPKGTTPSLRTGGSTNAGALFYKTSDSTIYYYTGSRWLKLSDSMRYVPYTGAINNVDLGTYGLTGDFIKLNVSPSGVPSTESTMSWNNTDGTMDIKLKGGAVTLQVGQEQVVRVVNKTGSNLLESEYKAVYLSGAQGQRAKADLAQANSALGNMTIGLVTENIDNNQEGYITSNGLVRNINTTGSLQSETWADGDALYLSPTTAGAVTNIAPTAPNYQISIGIVVNAHATQGSIFVKVGFAEALNDLTDVQLNGLANNDLLVYESSSSLWKNKTFSAAGGITGSGTTNYVSKFTSSSAVGNSSIFDNGTSVGIGTASPSATYKLEVNGEASINGVRVGRGAGNDASNTAVGASALNANTTALNNSAFGNQALLSTTTGGMNVALGVTAMRFNTTGFQNVAVGVSAGHFTNSYGSNAASDNSVYLGYETKASASGNTNEIVIGASALGGGSNTVTLGNSSIVNTYLKGQANVATINNATTDTDKFLVSDGGVVKYRTGAEVLSDIGGASAASISGTTNYIPKFTSSSAIGNSQIFDNGTSVGIGTAIPSVKLEVVSSGATGSTITSYDATATKVYNQVGGTSGNQYLQLGVTASSTFFNDYFGAAMTFKMADSEKMRLTSAGSLGIGTSAPSEKLEVNGAIRATGAVTNNATGAVLSYQGSSGSLLGAWGEDASTRGFITFYLANSTGTTGFAAMRLNQTGLGIGTTSPASTLHVVGSESRFGGVASGFISVYNATGRSGYIQANGGTDLRIASDTDPMTYYVNGSERMRLDASGNLGLGVTPSAWGSAFKAMQINAGGAIWGSTNVTEVNLGGNTRIDVNNAQYDYISTGGASQYQQSGGQHIWKTAPSGTAGTAISFTQAMTLDASGRLAVGTSTFPTQNSGSLAGTAIFNGTVRISGSSTRYFTTGNGLELAVGSIYSYNRDLGAYNDLSINDAMAVKGAGNVGIGTTSPATLLQLNSGTGVNTTLSFSENGTLKYYNRYNAGDGSYQIVDVPNTTTRLHISSGGNVGIGTTSPAEKLQVSGNILLDVGYKLYGNANGGSTSSYVSLYNATDGGIDLMANYTTSKITFGTAGSERMRITSGGNVGISTTSPTSTLHTNGSLATAYSSKTANYTLTSSDHTIRFDAVTAAASLTANLPDATTCAGRIYVIVAKISATYNVTLDGNGTQTIGGSTTWGLWDGCNADATIVIQSDGANWQIISYYGFNSTC